MPNRQLVVPLGIPRDGYHQQRIGGLRLSSVQTNGLARILSCCEGERLERGTKITLGAHAILWVLEQAGKVDMPEQYGLTDDDTAS